MSMPDRPAFWTGRPEAPQGAHFYNDRLCVTIADAAGKPAPLLWHRAPGVHDWLPVQCQAHDSTPPLDQMTPEALATWTLSPSVYWPDCCGMHGFLTDGVWRDC